jgi:acyl-CoA dehydrogenase
LRGQVTAFMAEFVYPNEHLFEEQAAATGWAEPPVIAELQREARARGLWNLFLPHSEHGAGLTNLQYAPLAEIMGRSPEIAPRAFNCAAPDTGNMEVLAEFGTDAQRIAGSSPCSTGRSARRSV